MQRVSLQTTFYALVIIVSAVPVLYEPARHTKAFALPFMLLLSPVLFFLLLRRMKAEGTADLTLGQLYQRARKDGKLPRSPLETAAEWAFALAVALIVLH
jgi:hypothetical protein